MFVIPSAYITPNFETSIGSESRHAVISATSGRFPTSGI